MELGLEWVDVPGGSWRRSGREETDRAGWRLKIRLRSCFLRREGTDATVYTTEVVVME